MVSQRVQAYLDLAQAVTKAPDEATRNALLRQGEQAKDALTAADQAELETLIYQERTRDRLSGSQPWHPPGPQTPPRPPYPGSNVRR